MITTESRITRNGRADSALTCSASVGLDFATYGEQTATNPFAVYGERAQLIGVTWDVLMSLGIIPAVKDTLINDV